MDNHHAILAAELSSWPSKDELARLFEGDGYRVVLGRHSVRLADFDHVAFQDLAEGSVGRIDADAPTSAELASICRRVSRTLAKGGIRHRFEIYSEQDVLAVYMHHKWPKDW